MLLLLATVLGVPWAGEIVILNTVRAKVDRIVAAVISYMSQWPPENANKPAATVQVNCMANEKNSLCQIWLQCKRI